MSYDAQVSPRPQNHPAQNVNGTQIENTYLKYREQEVHWDQVTSPNSFPGGLLDLDATADFLDFWFTVTKDK